MYGRHGKTLSKKHKEGLGLDIGELLARSRLPEKLKEIVRFDQRDIMQAQCDIKKCLRQIHPLNANYQAFQEHLEPVNPLFLASWLLMYEQQEMLQRLNLGSRQTCKSEWNRAATFVWCDQLRQPSMRAHSFAWGILQVWLGIFWFCSVCWPFERPASLSTVRCFRYVLWM